MARPIIFSTMAQAVADIPDGASLMIAGFGPGMAWNLLAALYDPVWRGAIHSPLDFALALAAFGLVAMWRCPPWLVVLLSGLAGAAMAMV